MPKSKQTAEDMKGYIQKTAALTHLVQGVVYAHVASITVKYA